MTGDRTETERQASITALRSTRTNGLAVQTTIDYLGLPALTVRPTESLVHVTVTDVAELNRWNYLLPGHIRTAKAAEGVVTVTLYTNTPVRGDGSIVQIRVHTLAIEGEDLLIEVRRSEVRTA